MSYMIKCICCVCGKHLNDKPGGKKPNMISHGYCDDCYKDAITEIENIKGGVNHVNQISKTTSGVHT